MVGTKSGTNTKVLIILTICLAPVTGTSWPSFDGSFKTDQTKEPGTFGAEIVNSAVRKIRRSQLFSDDYDFLPRSAFLLTNFGTNNDTFRPGYFGGIWQLSETILNITKSEKLEPIHNKILSAFDINWSKVEWKDLTKPLFGALAVRLYLHTVTPFLPQTIVKQALLWQQLFGNSSNSYAEFITKITAFENGVEKCKGLFDLIILIDGSGSVGTEDFEKSKDFVVTLFNTYSTSDVRKGFVVYGDIAYLIFPLDNNYTQVELQDVVKNVGYPAQSTNTNSALMMAMDMVKTASPRPGVPSIVIIFTDGESNVGGGISNIKYAREANITMFAVGIGPRINGTELHMIAHNDSSRVMTVHDFTTLLTLANRLNAETCLVSQMPSVDEELEVILEKDEARYYTYPMTVEGVTVTLNKTTGDIEGYYSFKEENPSKSIHDGVLVNETTYIPPPPQLLEKLLSKEMTEAELADQLHIGIEGKGDGENAGTLLVEEGNNVLESSKENLNGNSTEEISDLEQVDSNKLNEEQQEGRQSEAVEPDSSEKGKSLDFRGLRMYSGSNDLQGQAKCLDNQVAFHPFPGRCDLYTLCACGVKVLLECAPGLFFDSTLSTCNFIQLVDCKDSPYGRNTQFGNSGK